MLSLNQFSKIHKDKVVVSVLSLIHEIKSHECIFYDILYGLFESENYT